MLIGVFHYLFIYLHLSGGLGSCMQKGCLCWISTSCLPLFIYLHLSGGMGRCMQKSCLCWRSAGSEDRTVVHNSVTSHPFPEFPPPPQHPTSQPPNHEWYDSWQDKRAGRGTRKALYTFGHFHSYYRFLLQTLK
jgi:hypothetical protein